MGQLLGVSISQGGPGMCSMAPLVYDYWTGREVSDSLLTMDLIADIDFKQKVEQVRILHHELYIT
jgi:hypothetical protein